MSYIAGVMVLHSGDIRQPLHQRAVVWDSFGVDGFEVDVRGHAQQSVADGLAKAGVHGQRDYQRADPGGDADDR